MASEITSSKVSRPNGYGVFTHTAEDGQKWHHGYVVTPHGFCAVWAEAHHHSVRFIHCGREYHCSQRKSLSVRGLVAKAARFADAVVRGEHG